MRETTLKQQSALISARTKPGRAELEAYAQSLESWIPSLDRYFLEALSTMNGRNLGYAEGLLAALGMTRLFESAVIRTNLVNANVPTTYILDEREYTEDEKFYLWSQRLVVFMIDSIANTAKKALNR